MSIESMSIKRKPNGHYVIDFLATGDSEPRTVGAATGSPVSQAIRLLDRLILLSDKIAGYNQ